MANGNGNGNGNGRKPWQRLTLSLLGIGIIAFMWRWAVFHLYVLPVAALPAFTSVTTNTFYAIAALVIFFVTGKMVYDWKNSTASSVIQQAETIFEHSERRDPKDLDDATIP